MNTPHNYCCRNWTQKRPHNLPVNC